MALHTTRQSQTGATSSRKLLRQLLSARSGKRSEQITDEQLALSEAELKAQGVNGEDLSRDAESGSDDNDPPASTGGTGTAKPRGRSPLPAHLKRERIVHDLAEAEEHCDACNQDLREFGEETVIYDYTPTRERAGPTEFLKGFKGHLQAGAYVVYDRFFADPARGLVEVGCWAHARRHFHKELDNDKARMGGVLAMIAHLYGVEKAARKQRLRGEELRLLRERDARPMLDRLHEYLMAIREQVLPKQAPQMSRSRACPHGFRPHSGM